MNIFLAKTSEGYNIKILAELLNQNLKTVVLSISEEGIKLCQQDDLNSIIIQFKLEKNKFNSFIFNSPVPLCVGINSKHFYEMLKSVKKRDSVQLSINSSKKHDLTIKIIPEKNTDSSESTVKFTEQQHMEMEDIDENYNNIIITPSSSFQKMCKGLKLSNKTTIRSKNNLITFSTNAEEVMSRSTTFGEEVKNNFPEYVTVFDTEQLTKISKIAGFCKNIQICIGNPLKFHADITCLGEIDIYINSFY